MECEIKKLAIENKKLKQDKIDLKKILEINLNE